MIETEGEKKNHGRKRTETEERKGLKHDERRPFRWVSCGIDFSYKIGELFEIWNQIVEPNLPTRRCLSQFFKLQCLI